MSGSVTTRAAPSALAELERRFDPTVFDAPEAPVRIRLDAGAAGSWDAAIDPPEITLEPAWRDVEPDAVLSAEPDVWERIAADVRAGMAAFRAGRLSVRRNLHLGVGFLAATSGDRAPERLRFERVRTSNHELSVAAAGAGVPLVCIHGLGGTKASFLPTIAALAPEGFRVVAVDLPGFGDSDKPAFGRYDAGWFADAVLELLDELELRGAHLVGNSMGGRVALEVGLCEPERVGRIVLLSPALAWLRERSWRWLLQLPLPQLGFLQPTPRWAVEPIVRRLVPGAADGWAAAGVDEFLRSYLTPHGRVAFYDAARNIYMDEPHGEDGFWTRLRELAADTLFIWGRHDGLVPISFMRHVERALPAARHVELPCGHVPQLEMSGRTHAEIRRFLTDR